MLVLVGAGVAGALWWQQRSGSDRPAAGAVDLLVPDADFPAGYGERRLTVPQGTPASGAQGTCSQLVDPAAGGADAAAIAATVTEPGGILPGYRDGLVERDLKIQVITPAPDSAYGAGFDAAIAACQEWFTGDGSGRRIKSAQLTGGDGAPHGFSVSRSDVPLLIVGLVGITRGVAYGVYFELHNRALTDADNAAVAAAFNQQRKRILAAQ